MVPGVVTDIYAAGFSVFTVTISTCRPGENVTIGVHLDVVTGLGAAGFVIAQEVTVIIGLVELYPRRNCKGVGQS